MNPSWDIGSIVKAEYKTGEYIGEITKLASPKCKVKILAVVKHPTQGDLHQPFEVEGVMFHQRRALAFQEQANIPNHHIHPFNGDIPDYQESLMKSLQREKESLQKTMKWTQKSLDELEMLQQEYFPST
jgi:kinase-associated protein B